MPMLAALILYIKISREPRFNFRADIRVSYCPIFFYCPAFSLMTSRCTYCWLEAKTMQYVTSLGAKRDVIRACNRVIRHVINKLLYRYGVSALGLGGVALGRASGHCLPDLGLKPHIRIISSKYTPLGDYYYTIRP